MKKIFLFVVLSFFTCNVKAQFNAYNMGRGVRMYTDGMLHIMKGEDDEAFESFLNGTNYTADNFSGLGICYELGFGTRVDTDKAWKLYCEGANRGSNECKLAIKRIRNDGFLPGTSESRNTFRNMIRMQQNALNNIYGNGTYNGGGYNNNNSGSSVYTRCTSCNGTGICSGCGGSRGKWADTGYYAGTNTRSWINCGSCRGSGKCSICYGRGKL
jgi:Sel1 repeat.